MRPKGIRIHGPMIVSLTVNYCTSVWADTKLAGFVSTVMLSANSPNANAGRLMLAFGVRNWCLHSSSSWEEKNAGRAHRCIKNLSIWNKIPRYNRRKKNKKNKTTLSTPNPKECCGNRFCVTDFLRSIKINLFFLPSSTRAESFVSCLKEH